MGSNANDARPLRLDVANLVQSLLELRNALQEAVLALSDYRCTLDCRERHAAQLQMLQLIDRAKARDYSAGGGH